jgi:hypothetical protein
MKYNPYANKNGKVQLLAVVTHPLDDLDDIVRYSLEHFHLEAKHHPHAFLYIKKYEHMMQYELEARG